MDVMYPQFTPVNADTNSFASLGREERFKTGFRTGSLAPSVNYHHLFPGKSTSTDKHFESITEDWSGRGPHVAFGPDDAVPLEYGRQLGRGAVGEVFEVRCRGALLALKRRYCRKSVTAAEIGEIDILRKLCHPHVIRMIGTFVQGPSLGILLHPVAICDLATFFDDFEAVYSRVALEPRQVERLSELGLPVLLWQHGCQPECFFLLSIIGCLTGAIEYLHSQRVRHRDLKPSNILLSRGRVWVTDFGSSTDFSARSTSQTESGERGTPKYFAPEVAQFLPSGRASDIFSLGCVFLEIMTLCLRKSLSPLRALRTDPHNYHSFQANIFEMPKWIEVIESRVPIHRHVTCEIQQMLAEDPQGRPTAQDLYRRLLYIDQFGAHNESIRLFDTCCRTTFYNHEHFRLENNRLTNKIRESQEQNYRLQQELEQLRSVTRIHHDPAYSAVYHDRHRTTQLAIGILVLVVVSLLTVPVFFFYHLSHKSTVDAIGVLVVFTLLFSATLSLLTKAKRHEVFAAAAAYCAVLVVFLGNQTD